MIRLSHRASSQPCASGCISEPRATGAFRACRRVRWVHGCLAAAVRPASRGASEARRETAHSRVDLALGAGERDRAELRHRFTCSGAGQRQHGRPVGRKWSGNAACRSRGDGLSDSTGSELGGLEAACLPAPAPWRRQVERADSGTFPRPPTDRNNPCVRCLCAVLRTPRRGDGQGVGSRPEPPAPPWAAGRFWRDR